MTAQVIDLASWRNRQLMLKVRERLENAIAMIDCECSPGSIEGHIVGTIGLMRLAEVPND